VTRRMASSPSTKPARDPAGALYEEQRSRHWDAVACNPGRSRALAAFYHRRLSRIYQFSIPPGQSVLEVGCGEGDLLASLRPARGVGVDFSCEIVRKAQQKHPDCSFVLTSIQDLEPGQTFDFIILSDLINDLWDVQTTLEHLHRFCTRDTRLIINAYSHLWALPHRAAQALRMATPLLPQNWLTVEDLHGLLRIADFDVIRSWPEILWPYRCRSSRASAIAGWSGSGRSASWR